MGLKSLRRSLLRALAARLGQWSAALLRHLGEEAAAPGEESAAGGGPPAHWVERVRRGAPHLLLPAPQSGVIGEALPARAAAGSSPLPGPAPVMRAEVEPLTQQVTHRNVPLALPAEKSSLRPPEPHLPASALRRELVQENPVDPPSGPRRPGGSSRDYGAHLVVPAAPGVGESDPALPEQPEMQQGVSVSTTPRPQPVVQPAEARNRRSILTPPRPIEPPLRQPATATTGATAPIPPGEIGSETPPREATLREDQPPFTTVERLLVPTAEIQANGPISAASRDERAETQASPVSVAAGRRSDLPLPTLGQEAQATQRQADPVFSTSLSWPAIPLATTAPPENKWPSLPEEANEGRDPWDEELADWTHRDRLHAEQEGAAWNA